MYRGRRDTRRKIELIGIKWGMLRLSPSLTRNDRSSRSSIASLSCCLCPGRSGWCPSFPWEGMVVHQVMIIIIQSQADAATRASFVAVLQANQNKPEPQVRSFHLPSYHIKSPSSNILIFFFRWMLQLIGGHQLSLPLSNSPIQSSGKKSRSEYNQPLFIFFPGDT